MLKYCDIKDDSFVADLVIQDYRTSSIFRKYEINYCCEGKLTLQLVCERRSLDTEKVKKELVDAVRDIEVSNSTNFNQWSDHFLVDYIINVHHAYLLTNLPDILDTLARPAVGFNHEHTMPDNLLEAVYELRDHLLPHLEEEEKIIFPYIKQIAHAYENHEPYAALLVRTLRKPVENVTNQEYISKSLRRLREMTNNYTPVSNANLLHKVIFFKLKEMDNDLVQHIHLESNILFPKAIAMEKQMLALK